MLSKTFFLLFEVNCPNLFAKLIKFIHKIINKVSILVIRFKNQRHFSKKRYFLIAYIDHIKIVL